MKIKRCETILSQVKGYMFTKPKEDGIVFIFKKERKVDLHTFFVFTPLSILYLDKEKKIKEIKKVKPFTLFIKGPKAHYILETHKEISFKKGQSLDF